MIHCWNFPADVCRFPRFNIDPYPRTSQASKEVEQLYGPGGAVLTDHREDGEGNTASLQSLDPGNNTIECRTSTSIHAMSVCRPLPVNAYSDPHAVPIKEIAPFVINQCRTGLNLVLDTPSHPKRLKIF